MIFKTALGNIGDFGTYWYEYRFQNIWDFFGQIIDIGKSELSPTTNLVAQVKYTIAYIGG